MRLERRAQCAYSLPMDDNPTPHRAPAELLEAIARSKAELAAGLTVPGEVVHQHIRDSIARMAAKRAAAPRREAATRR